MIITLDRHSHNLFGTFGVLRAGDYVMHTVEQDWENNMPYKSCIPNGTYDLAYHNSPKHGASFILCNENLGIGKYEGDAKRFGCLIHKANLASELQGCIAPGTSLGFYKNQWSVSSSGVALKRLFSVVDVNEPNSLVITSSFPSFEEF